MKKNRGNKIDDKNMVCRICKQNKNIDECYDVNEYNLKYLVCKICRAIVFPKQ